LFWSMHHRVLLKLYGNCRLWLKVLWSRDGAANMTSLSNFGDEEVTTT